MRSHNDRINGIGLMAESIFLVDDQGQAAKLFALTSTGSRTCDIVLPGGRTGC